MMITTIVLLSIMIFTGAIILIFSVRVRTSNPNRKLTSDGVWETSFEAVEKMRIGWNLGNTLDTCNNIEFYGNPNSTPYDYEMSWGNPITTEEMIKTVKSAGFEAARIPVTWYEHLDENNNIDEQWMARVNEIVDYVINEGMYCIINVHHDTGTDGWLKASYTDFDSKSERFVKIWEQISARFKNYDEKLIFEGFNEMLNDNGDWSNPGDDAFEVLNYFNQLYVDTVRESGGNNEYRNLIVATYACSSAPKQIINFSLPKDKFRDHLIVTVHNYSPAQFTVGESDWIKTSDKLSLGNKILTSMEYLYFGTYFKFLETPLIVGEFGNVWKDNPEESCEYAAMVVKLMKNYDITGFCWDDGGMYELLDRKNLKWKRPGYVESMMEVVN